ncbi:MAG: PH domain-containing protein [Planctomycetota bacterium]|nr:PH domain-containing protein [Planctomycetota bacterium]
MTPSAEPTSQRADIAAHLVPADLLGDGEIIILAIKPSGWFVLLASLPVLISALVVTVIAYVVNIYRSETPAETIICFCAAVAILRALGACWQWLGRTYVLTNHRIVTVRGLVHIRVSSAALMDIRRPVLTATITERLFGTGSICCLTASQSVPAVVWSAVDKPAQVHEMVLEAVNRSRK